MLNHKEMTAHLRKRIKQRGIKARVRMSFCNEGAQVIQVIVPTFDARFTSEEIREFCHIAECNHLTCVRGMPILPAHEAELTGKQQWNFYMPIAA